MSLGPTALSERTNWLPAGDTDDELRARMTPGVEAPTPPAPPPPEEDDLPPVTHFAKPQATGNEDGSSLEDAFQIADFWPVADPGDRLMLADAAGAYIGPDSNIEPPSGLSGTPEDRIYITAETDGGARLDGDGSRLPIRLANNTHFYIAGMNLHNGSSGSVVGVFSGAIFNIIRKFCAWDGMPVNQSGSVINVAGSWGNLIEDFAGWGWGRRIFQDYQSTAGDTSRPGNVFRRGFFIFEGWDDSGVKKAMQIGYQGANTTAENIIGMWDTAPGVSVQRHRGHFCFGRTNDHYPIEDQNCALLGSIGLCLSEHNEPPDQFVDGFSANGIWHLGGNLIRDLLLYTEQHLRNERMLRLQEQSAKQSLAENLTQIGDSGPTADFIHGTWTVTNRVEAATVGAAPSPWGHAGAGARVAFRTVDRVLTETPLWPWPMDARIRAALIQSGRDPDTIFRGSGNGVTELCESIWGPIPAEFRSD